MAEMQEVLALRGRPVYASDGEKIGKVEDLYLDNDTGQPEWIGIGTGIFGMKHVVVPVAGYTERADGIAVPYPKERVQDSPDVDEDEIPEQQEVELYEYYGFERRGFRPPAAVLDRARLRKWSDAGPADGPGGEQGPRGRRA